MTASALACIGVCGYLIGLALPVAPAFDGPLAFLAVLTALAAVSGTDRARLGGSMAAAAVFAFATTRVVCSMLAPHGRGTAEVFAPLLPALLVFVALAAWVDGRQHIESIFLTLTVAGTVLAIGVIAVAWSRGSSDPDTWARMAPSPMLVVKNDVTMAAVLAPFALASAALRPRRLTRAIVGVFFASLVTVICVVQSRTALLAMLVAVTAFAALAWRPGRLRTTRLAQLLAGIAAAAVAVDALAGFPLVYKTLHDWQGSGRLALWLAALGMFRDAPLLGHGPNAFGLQYRHYLDALQLPTWIEVDPRVTPWAHNLYLEVAAEQGIVGLVSLLALAVAGLAMMRELGGRRDDLQWLAAGAGAALLAFLAAALVELSFIRAWVTIVLFTLLGLLTAIRRYGKQVSA